MPPVQSLRPSAIDADYQMAEAMLAQNQLKEASDKCREILMADPRYANGWFLLGKLYQHTGNLPKGIEFLSKAIEFAHRPDDAHYYVRGNMKLVSQDFQGAREDLEQSLALGSQLAVAALFAGTACIQLREYNAAHQHLKRAAKMGMPNEALEQEGLLYQQEGKLDEALAAFEKLLKLRPNYAFAFFHRGMVLLGQGQTQAALEDADRALSIDLNFERAWLLKALAYTEMEDLDRAAYAAQQAVNLSPTMLQSRHVFANTLLRKGVLYDAVDVYRNILTIDPKDSVALNALPTYLMILGQVEEAKDYLTRALEQDPENPALKHFMAAANQQTPETAAPDYISGLFDGYAEQFDHSLQEKLHYRIPEKAAAAMRHLLALDASAKPALSMLDLGCGTGLGAVAFESLTDHRIGIDLSPKMLEKANLRNLYNDLFVADLVPFLESTETAFDIITSLDVFIYIGNLSPVFAAIKPKLASGGHLVFSVEKLDDDQDYVLRSTGRFAHSEAYLRRLAAENGYRFDLFETTEVRIEKTDSLDGYLVILSAA